MGIRHVGVAVSDISRSILFYEQLGFKLRFRVERGPETFVGRIVGYPQAHLLVAMLDGYEATLELIQYIQPCAQGMFEKDPERYQPGQQHVCFEATFRMIAAMEKHAHRVGSWVEIPDGPQKGSRVAYFFGPDREVIELFQSAL